ncbi:MAG: hypothetical protein GY862_12710 [Gammaproteobacteria bacterium]|nr:hypothetical protein [Gammaproteobacteria bacterium]
MSSRKPFETDGIPDSQFLVCQAEDGDIKIDVRFQNETVWLTQQQIAELFQSSKQNISHHVNSVYEMASI